ncbi:hypothetical protein SASPL_105671 [Salvia splendens]|uniref:Uncharacterized protein n=1 Tax=Salvia splendens TaxID=180675 RepID=A0A4D9A1J4_SALSN|nr:hypothetical protein SASPL_128395 [Salvia splendens]KAG6421666.1 hypothetical protein SASPL_118223 [Salvia splendens]KAG6434050.1 hypothetical protein SASPL_105671 [Salvia splendens]
MGGVRPTAAEVNDGIPLAGEKAVDAGAQFFLKSRGDQTRSWIHCGYHLSTSIVAPTLLSLPRVPRGEGVDDPVAGADGGGVRRKYD